MYRFSRTHLLVSVVAFIGIVQFLVAVPMAIHRYPAGILGKGYSMSDNFLSDLGCSRTFFWQEDNSASAAIFNRSAIILGASLLPFFSILPTTIGRLRKLVWISGILSALGLIGIGLTPYDLHFTAHNTALALWIGPMFVLLAGHLIACGLDEQTSSARTACTLALLCAILAYALAGTRTEVVVMQKLTVAVAIVWFSVIGASVGGTMVRIISASARRQMIERQAEEYMETLQHGHLRQAAARFPLHQAASHFAADRVEPVDELVVAAESSQISANNRKSLLSGVLGQVPIGQRGIGDANRRGIMPAVQFRKTVGIAIACGSHQFGVRPFRRCQNREPRIRSCSRVSQDKRSSKNNFVI